MASKTTKKRKKTAAPRKRPQQERSRRRHDAIVEAAAQSFAEFGFEATTMEGIAATAGTSIGSVYQFFPNKMAVFREVAQRAIAATGVTFAKLMVPGTERHWTELLEQTCELFFEFHRSDVAMQAVVRNFELYREFEAEDMAQMQSFIEIIAMVMRNWAPNLDPDHAKRVAANVVYTIGLSLVLRAREPEAEGRLMLEETKRMVRSYLETYTT